MGSLWKAGQSKNYILGLYQSPAHPSLSVSPVVEENKNLVVTSIDAE